MHAGQPERFMTLCLVSSHACKLQIDKACVASAKEVIAECCTPDAHLRMVPEASFVRSPAVVVLHPAVWMCDRIRVIIRVSCALSKATLLLTFKRCWCPTKA